MDTRQNLRRSDLEPFPDWAGRVKAACADDCEILFILAFGEPERRSAATWRAKASPAVTMETRGRKRGLWKDHSSHEGGGPLELFALAVMDRSGKPKGEAYKEAIADAARRYGVTRDGSEAAPLSAAEQEQRRRDREEAAAEHARKAEAEAEAEAQKDGERRRSATIITYNAVALDDPAAEPARRYLAARGLDAPDAELCFLPADTIPATAQMRGVAHPEAPALVLILRDAEGQGVAVQRITLLPDGSDRDRERGKLYTGAAKAAEPFRFAPRPDDVTGGALIFAEGFESAAALWTATGAEVLAGLDAGGLGRAIEAAPHDRRVIVASDRDALGNHARATIDKACAALALRHPDAWRAMASPDLIPIPAPDAQGKIRDGADAADVLKRHGAEAVRRMIAEAARLEQKEDAEPPAWDDAPPPAPEDYGAAPKPEDNFKTPELVLMPDAPPSLTPLWPEEAQGELGHVIWRFWTERARAWLDAAPETRGPPPVIVIRATTGLGKTAGVQSVVARILAERPELRLAVASPTLAMSEQWADGLAKRAPEAASHVARGRGAPNPKAPGKAMCARPKIVEALAKIGQSVQSAICEGKHKDSETGAWCAVKCRFYAKCAYQDSLRTKTGIALESHAHLQASVAAGRSAEHAPGLRIIDEAAHGTFQSKAKLSPETLTARRLQEAGQAKGAKLAAALDMIAEAAPDMERAGRAVIDALEDKRDLIAAMAAEGFTAEDFRHFAKVEAEGIGRFYASPIWTDDAIVKAAEGYAERRKRRQAEAMRRLWLILAEGMERGWTRGVVLEKRPGAEGEEVRTIRLFWRSEPPRDAPTILLDATAEPEIIAELFPGAEFVALDARQNLRVTQVWDTEGAKSRMIEDAGPIPAPGKKLTKQEKARGARREAARKKRRERATFIRAAVARHGAGRVLYVDWAEVLALLAKDAGEDWDQLKPGKMTGRKLHGASVLAFGPQARGLDDFKGFDCVIIGGRFYSEAAIEAQARAFYQSGPPLDFSQEEVLTAYDAKPGDMRPRVGVKAKRFKDPRVEALARSMREATTAQAIGRLRAVWREGDPAEVFILSNIPIPGIAPDRLMTLAEAGPNDVQSAALSAGAQEATQGKKFSPWRGVLDLSSKGLTLAAPEIFLSEAAAKKHLQRAKKDQSRKGDKSLIDIYRGMSPFLRDAEERGFSPASPLLPTELCDGARGLLAGPWRPCGIGLFVSFRREGQPGRDSQAFLATCDRAEGCTMLSAWLERQGERLKAGSFRVIFDLTPHDGADWRSSHDDPPPAPWPPHHDAYWSPQPSEGGMFPLSGGFSLAETAELDDTTPEEEQEVEPEEEDERRFEGLSPAMRSPSYRILLGESPASAWGRASSHEDEEDDGPPPSAPRPLRHDGDDRSRGSDRSIHGRDVPRLPRPALHPERSPRSCDPAHPARALPGAFIPLAEIYQHSDFKRKS